MLNNLIGFISIFLLNHSSFAQDIWIKSQNNLSNNECTTVIELENKNYLFAVSNSDIQSIPTKIVTKLILTNPLGLIIDSIPVAINNDSSIVITEMFKKGNHVIITGFCDKKDSSIFWRKAFFKEYDSIFNIITTKTFNSKNLGQYFFNIKTTKLNNNYAILCQVTDSNEVVFADTNENYFIRLNEQGDSISTFVVNSKGYRMPAISTSTINSIYLLSPYSQGVSGGVGFIYNLNLNWQILDSLPLKVIQYNKAFVGAPFEVKKISNSSMIISGNTQHDFNFNNLLSCGKMSSHDSMPSKVDTLPRVTLNDNFHYIGDRNDNLSFISTENIYYGGTNFTQSFGSINNSIMIKNIDSNLNVHWLKYFGGDASYRLSRLVATSDGGCLVLAKRDDTSIPGLDVDLYIFKIDSLGNPMWQKNFSQIEDDISLYPNPSTNIISLKCKQQIVTYEILNLNGQIISQNHFDKSIDITHLSNGQYFLKVVNDAGRYQVLKFVKE